MTACDHEKVMCQKGAQVQVKVTHKNEGKWAHNKSQKIGINQRIFLETVERSRRGKIITCPVECNTRPDHATNKQGPML
jgi:hypothetical protein